MGTATLATILILQVVAGVYSSIIDRPQLSGGSNDHGLPEAAKKQDYFMSKGKPMVQGVTTNSQKDNSLDHVNEDQRPPSSSMKGVSTDISFGNEIINNAIRSTTEATVTTKGLAGAGSLEEKEIANDRNALPKKATSSDSSNNKNSNTKELKKRREPVTEEYHFPDLDKAMESLVNNLPSSDKFAPVPIIKSVNQESSYKSVGPKDLTGNSFSQKHAVSKLTRSGHSEKKLEDTRIQTQNVKESQVKKQTKEDVSAQVQNQNENHEETQPCDCEGDYDVGIHQTQIKPVEITSPRQDNQSVNEDQQTNNGQKPKSLAHVGVMQKQPESEKAPNRQAEHMLPKVTMTKSVSTKAIPLSPFADNKDVLLGTREQLNTGMATEGCGDRGDEDDNSQENIQTSNSRFASDEDDDESSQERRSSYTRYKYPDQELQNLLFPDKKVVHHRQTFPKEFILLKYFNNFITEKASTDSLRERQEKQFAQYDPSNLNAESPNSPFSSTTRLVLTGPNNPLPTPQLPPLYFPQDNSGYKIKQVNNPEAFLNNRKTLPKNFILLKHITDIMKEKAAANAFRERQDSHQLPQYHLLHYKDSSNFPSSPVSKLMTVRPPLHSDESSGYKIKHVLDPEDFLKNIKLKQGYSDLEEDKPRNPVQLLNDVQKVDHSDVLTQEPTNRSSQDIPWFISNILANIRKAAREDSLQPSSTRFTPVHKPFEEINPVLVRAVLAPFAI